MHTLVLSKSWVASRVVAWQEAMRLVFSGRAETIEYHDDHKVRTIDKTFQMPSVIRMYTGKYYRPRKANFSKKNVFFRDNGQCQYCSKKLKISESTFDHVVPKSQGGKTSWENIVLACSPCNQKKADRTPKQANMLLLKKPVAPKAAPSVKATTTVKERWLNYL